MTITVEEILTTRNYVFWCNSAAEAIAYMDGRTLFRNMAARIVIARHTYYQITDDMTHAVGGLYRIGDLADVPLYVTDKLRSAVIAVVDLSHADAVRLSLNTSHEVAQSKYADIYTVDPTLGKAVDLMADLPFVSFSVESSTPEPQVEGYAMEYKPTVRERILKWFGFHRASLWHPIPEPEENLSQTTHQLRHTISWSDRIRILLRGNFETVVHVHEPADGKTGHGPYQLHVTCATPWSF